MIRYKRSKYDLCPIIHIREMNIISCTDLHRDQGFVHTAENAHYFRWIYLSRISRINPLIVIESFIDIECHAWSGKQIKIRSNIKTQTWLNGNISKLGIQVFRTI